MYRQQFFPRLGDYIDTLLKVTKLTKSIVCVTGGMGGSTYNALKGIDMHFSIYVRLLDLLWEHLDDEDRFRRLAHEAVERYIAYMRGRWMKERINLIR